MAAKLELRFAEAVLQEAIGGLTVISGTQEALLAWADGIRSTLIERLESRVFRETMEFKLRQMIVDERAGMGVSVSSWDDVQKFLEAVATQAREQADSLRETAEKWKQGKLKVGTWASMVNQPQVGNWQVKLLGEMREAILSDIIETETSSIPRTAHYPQLTTGKLGNESLFYVVLIAGLLLMIALLYFMIRGSRSVVLLGITIVLAIGLSVALVILGKQSSGVNLYTADADTDAVVRTPNILGSAMEKLLISSCLKKYPAPPSSSSRLVFDMSFRCVDPALPFTRRNRAGDPDEVRFLEARAFADISNEAIFFVGVGGIMGLSLISALVWFFSKRGSSSGKPEKGEGGSAKV
jgi:hypothetical protein